MSTAGSVAHDIIQCNDEYDNDREKGGDSFAMRVAPTVLADATKPLYTSRSAHATIVDNADGSHAAEYTAYKAHGGSARVSLAQRE